MKEKKRNSKWLLGQKQKKKCPRRESGLQPSAWTLHQLQLIYRRGGGGGHETIMCFTIRISVSFFFFSQIDLSGCGVSKGCYRTPTGCRGESDCSYIYTQELQSDGQTVKFELFAAKTFALGCDWIQHGSTNGTSLLIHMICTTVGLTLCEDQIVSKTGTWSRELIVLYALSHFNNAFPFSPRVLMTSWDAKSTLQELLFVSKMPTIHSRDTPQTPSTTPQIR